MSVPDRFNGVETVEVVLFWKLGMTSRQSQAFCRQLNDSPIAGISAIKLALMLKEAIDHIDAKRKMACDRAQEMIDQFKRVEPTLWPRN